MIQRLRDLRHLLLARRMSADGLERWRLERLRQTIRHAAATVPFYRERFRAAGVDADAVRSLADLARLPVTEKSELIDAGVRAFATDVDPAACTRKNTSGSTGRSWRMPATAAETREHELIIFRTLLGMGLGPLDRLAVASAVGRHRTRFYQRLGLFRSINVSRFLSPGEQLLALQRFQPTFLWAYPTVLRKLLPLVDDQLSRVIRPRAIMTAGEVLEPQLRRRLADDLDAEFFNLYGSTEVGIIAGECRAHRGLHVVADRMLLECVGADGPVPAGERGQAVVTCLGPRAVPMIRYRVGDVIRMLVERCPCGSAFPLIEAPVGRADDALRLPDGRLLYPAECDAFVGCHEVLQYRFVQTAPDRVRVEVQLRGVASAAALAQLEARAKAYLGGAVRAELETVERFNEQGIKFRIFRPLEAPPQ